MHQFLERILSNLKTSVPFECGNQPLPEQLPQLHCVHVLSVLKTNVTHCVASFTSEVPLTLMESVQVY